MVQVLRQRASRLLVAAGVHHPAVVRGAWHPIAPDLVTAALSVRADLYIAHYPAALPAAAIAAQHHQALYAFDAEDFHLGDAPEGPEHHAERRMIHAIEARYLPGCAYVTAASPGIADGYVQAYGIPRPTVVLNVFPRSQGPSRSTSRGTAAPPSIYWFSQTIGTDRGLECAVRAIGRARTRPHLYLRGTPAAGFLDCLRIIAREVGAGERLHVLPPTEPAEMARLAAAYDVGLVGETGHTQSRRIALTNKQFTYLLAGIPVLMSDIPAHRTFAPSLGEAARLYPVDDDAALAQALDALLGDPVSLATARNTAWRLGQERFNWDVEQSALLGCVAAALGPAQGIANTQTESCGARGTAGRWGML
jgi:glycosyltransferase involved in cell wall biosynthesis